MQEFDITLAGEINLDIILYGLPEELPQERELLTEDCVITLGSSSAILAHNLSVLGSRVGFIARVGQDPLTSISIWTTPTSKTIVRIPSATASAFFVPISSAWADRGCWMTAGPMCSPPWT